MKTESTKIQEKKLETLEEATVSVLFESTDDEKLRQCTEILNTMEDLAAKLIQLLPDMIYNRVADEVEDLPRKIVGLNNRIWRSSF